MEKRKLIIVVTILSRWMAYAVGYLEKEGGLAVDSHVLNRKYWTKEVLADNVAAVDLFDLRPELYEAQVEYRLWSEIKKSDPESVPNDVLLMAGLSRF